MYTKHDSVAMKSYSETGCEPRALLIQEDQWPQSAARGRRFVQKYQAKAAMLIVMLVFNVLKLLSVKLAARWLNHMCWFRPWTSLEREWETVWLRSARHFTVINRGKPLKVYTWGEGRSVLLTHGWSGRGLQFCAFIQTLLNAGFKPVTFDAPAHGRSPGSRTDFLEIAEAIRSVAKHIGPLHAIISHSTGCVPSLLAIQDGLVVQRMICISPIAMFDTLLRAFAAKLRLSQCITNEQRHLLENTYGNALYERFSPAVIVKDLYTAALIIHDRDDVEVPWDEAHMLTQAWRNAQLISTRGLGHYRILRDPDVANHAVMFLTSPA
jgi:pimeloyl-ACP methyl ester carboxylesterase